MLKVNGDKVNVSEFRFYRIEKGIWKNLIKEQKKQNQSKLNESNKSTSESDSDESQFESSISITCSQIDDADEYFDTGCIICFH